MPYFACSRQITSNSTYFEAKHCEIYLPEGRLGLILPFEAKYVEFYLFGGQTSRNLPTWR